MRHRGETLVEAARDGLAPRTAAVLESVTQILAEAHEVEMRLASAGPGVPALAAALEDMRAQVGGLIYPGFIAETGATRLPDLVHALSAQTEWQRMPAGRNRSSSPRKANAECGAYRHRGAALEGSVDATENLSGSRIEVRSRSGGVPNQRREGGGTHTLAGDITDHH